MLIKHISLPTLFVHWLVPTYRYLSFAPTGTYSLYLPVGTVPICLLTFHHTALFYNVPFVSALLLSHPQFGPHFIQRLSGDFPIDLMILLHDLPAKFKLCFWDHPSKRKTYIFLSFYAK